MRSKKQKPPTGKIIWVENNFTPEVQAAYLAEASRVLFEIILPMADDEPKKESTLEKG